MRLAGKCQSLGEAEPEEPHQPRPCWVSCWYQQVVDGQPGAWVGHGSRRPDGPLLQFAL